MPSKSVGSARSDASRKERSAPVPRRTATRTDGAPATPFAIAFARDYAPAPESVKVEIADRHGLFINGAFVEPRGDGPAGERWFETVNPATEGVLSHIARAGAADVDAAVRAAREALPSWAGLPARERGKYLYRIARRIQERARELAVLETLDGGKPIKESRDVDVPLAAAHFFYHAGWADKLGYAFPGRHRLAACGGGAGRDGTGFNPVPPPVGVCGQIIPWNFPLLMAAWKLAPALACGNTCVLKPAETTSLTALRLAEIFQEVGLPRGVVNIVTGEGATGAALVEHPGVDKIAFTGSTEVGKRIARAVAQGLKVAQACSLGSSRSDEANAAGDRSGLRPEHSLQGCATVNQGCATVNQGCATVNQGCATVNQGCATKRLTLELGGKSPNIIFEDASLDQAVEGIVAGIYFNQGHVCCAGSRLFVQESIAGEVEKRLRARLSTLRVGDPMDKNTDLGAINSRGQLEKIEQYLSAGVEEGASLRVCGVGNGDEATKRRSGGGVGETANQGHSQTGGRRSAAGKNGTVSRSPSSRDGAAHAGDVPPAWRRGLPDRGYWCRPCFFTGVQPSHTVARDEIFGPVLAVMTFRTPEEALVRANSTPYGLAAGVWTDKGSKIFEIARRVKAGVVWLNTYNKFDPGSPFGGFKESGFGREGGVQGLRGYVDLG